MHTKEKNRIRIFYGLSMVQVSLESCHATPLGRERCVTPIALRDLAKSRYKGNETTAGPNQLALN